MNADNKSKPETKATKSKGKNQSYGKKPMQGRPSKIAIVAGIAPFCLTIASTSLAVSKFWGYGIPTNKLHKGLKKHLFNY